MADPACRAILRCTPRSSAGCCSGSTSCATPTGPRACSRARFVEIFACSPRLPENRHFIETGAVHLAVVDAAADPARRLAPLPRLARQPTLRIADATCRAAAPRSAPRPCPCIAGLLVAAHRARSACRGLRRSLLSPSVFGLRPGLGLARAGARRLAGRLMIAQGDVARIVGFVFAHDQVPSVSMSSAPDSCSSGRSGWTRVSQSTCGSGAPGVLSPSRFAMASAG